MENLLSEEVIGAGAAILIAVGIFWQKIKTALGLGKKDD